MTAELIEISQTQPFANITWQVSNICNYRCSYCNRANWDGSNLNLNIDKFFPGVDKLIEYQLRQGNTKLKVFFSGGEPSLWKPLIPTMKHMYTKGFDEVKYAINTNLSVPLDWWITNHIYFDDIIASYHPEFSNDDGYIKKYIFLASKVNYVCARIMMDENNWDKSITLSEKLKEECDKAGVNWIIEYAPIFDDLIGGATPYIYKNPKCTEFFKKTTIEKSIKYYVEEKVKNISNYEVYSDGSTRPLNSNNLVVERKNFFKGWKCMLPSENIFISSSGNIVAGSCGVMEDIGNIYDPLLDIHLPDWIICPKHHCHCGTDINISKKKHFT